MKKIELLPNLPKRKKNSHKGHYGKILVIAGSKGMMGAAYLTTKATLRSGAGLVTLATPASEMIVAATKLTCAMTFSLANTAEGSINEYAKDQLAPVMNTFDAVAIGPGISQQKQTQKFVRDIVKLIQAPIVIDADGLNALVGNLGILKSRRFPTILTPHPGEFSRLANVPIPEVARNGVELARNFASEHNVTIVLKIAPSVVVAADRYYVNTTGNPGMATGGSGDILTGVITSLLAQNFLPFEAAQLGAFIHGKAGDLASFHLGEIGMIATDILEYLPYAFKNYQNRD